MELMESIKIARQVGIILEEDEYLVNLEQQEYKAGLLIENYVNERIKKSNKPINQTG